MKSKLVFLAAVVLAPVAVSAQNAQQDFSKVEIKTTKVTEKFYTSNSNALRRGGAVR